MHELAGAGEQGKRSRGLEDWKETIQTDGAQGAQRCAFGLVKLEAEFGSEAAGIGSARLEPVHSWPYMDNPVRVQVQVRVRVQVQMQEGW